MRLIIIAACAFVGLFVLDNIERNQRESIHIQKEILEQLQNITKCDTIPCYETPD